MDEQAREEFFRVKKVVEKKKIKLQKEKAEDHRKSGKPGEFTNPTSETCPCVVKSTDMIEQFSQCV